jgi:Spy/CpxP family protein refolding chaperone
MRKILFLGAITLTVINIAMMATMMVNKNRTADDTIGAGPLTTVTRALSLNEAQAEEFASKRATFEEDLDTVRQRMMESRHQLMAELRATQPDTTRINSLIDDIALLQKSIETHAVKLYLSERSMLDSTQQVQYFSEMETCMRGMGMGKGMGMGMGRSGTSRGMGQRGSGRYGKQ